jgi:hypothetical protein
VRSQSLIIVSCLISILALWASIGFTQVRIRQESSPQRTAEIAKINFPDDAIEIVGIKNLQSKDFPIGLELEVRNKASKPLYYHDLVILLLDAKSQLSGTPYVLTLTFGNKRLVRNSELANENDIAAQPGEIYILKPLSKQAESLHSFLDKLNLVWTGTKRLLLHSQIINYGDGTGYRGKDFVGNKNIAFVLEDGCEGLCGGFELSWQEGACGLEECTLRYVSASSPSLPSKEDCKYATICSDSHGDPNECTDHILFPCGADC